ncbi:HEAT repeat domain-containing protein [Pyxidicoccus fallax]|uniref:HEAT repeat domain-containing protein n=1 Tax=Pyxidicoccus fallax TaxID=394095 RepID=A0A848LVL9_9BACT|nr:HEAT repeat domain-containing protein [Pyxidicoccus fallax]NMO21846.1 HEAT repeat domain-containing protein [Pyxidicoccus fallax]NPC83322.1 HEAT repeat domain-containing protein [Pyxidicoccus fallax]
MLDDTARYVVLKPGVKRQEFEQAALAVGLVKHREREGDGQKESYQQIWATQDEENSVHYVEDPLSGTTFFSIRGPKQQSLVFELARRVWAFAPEELIELAQEAETHDEQVKAVFRLAVANPRYQPDVFNVFSVYATKPPNPLLRAATLNAIGYRCWPECIPLLEGVARDDADAQVRQTAERLLPYLRQAAERANRPQ